ncbi:MAG: hypothetical protein MUP97_05130 [Acidimicrobiia bacterium]|nr:hypothetical protein [Acidimicrobiia bacterium]
MAARSRTIAILTSTLVMLSGPTALALGGSDGGEAKGSLVAQALHAVDGSLGAAAPVAIMRANDRGYDVVQVLEAILDERLADDGTITDEDGAAVAPFRGPSGLIEGDPPGSGEEIGIAPLERAIDKATAKLDKKFDLQTRAERAAISDESNVFVGMAVIGLMAEGYSPEQILADGLQNRGITLRSATDLVIVDDRGKALRPDGVEESPEHQESSAAIDSFVAGVVDVIGGVDPHAAAETAFDAKFKGDIEITIESNEGASFRIVGEAKLGTPDDQSLRTFVVGNGDGKFAGGGACSVGAGEGHPYEVAGNVRLGLSGPVNHGTADLRIAITEAKLEVTGDDSLCVGVVRDTTDIFELVTYGPVEIRLRDEATASATSQFIDVGDTVTTKVTLTER